MSVWDDLYLIDLTTRKDDGIDRVGPLERVSKFCISLVSFDEDNIPYLCRTA